MFPKPRSLALNTVSSATHCGKPDLIPQWDDVPGTALFTQVSSEGQSELGHAEEGVAVSE